MAYIISSGDSSDGIILNKDSMNVFSGGTANSTTLNPGGSLYVSSGGIADGVIVNSGATLSPNTIGADVKNVEVNAGGLVLINGGSATGLTVHSGGSIHVSYGGGFASNASLEVGAVVSTYYGGYFNLVSASSAITFDRINNGGAYANSGQSDFTFTGNLSIESGGSAFAVSIQKGGSLYISSGGTADGVIVNSSATLSPNTIGADVKNVEVNAGGLVLINGGSATGISVHSGGSIHVSYGGGFASNASLEVGAVVSTYYGGYFNLVSASSAITFDRINNGGAYANNGQSKFSFAGSLYVESGGSASSFSIQKGALLLYGSAGDITLNGGYAQTYSTTQLNGATVNAGATFNLTSVGADVKNVEVNAGGLVLINGGSATGLTVHSGGSIHVSYGGGFASNASLEVGAVVLTYYGGYFNLVSASSAITFDRINNGGAYANSGQSDFTFTGNLSIESGGSAFAVSIQKGGSLYISSGGTADGVIVNSGATLSPNTIGADVKNVEVNAGGLVLINGGSATGISVHSGGSIHVSYGGGFASNASLDAGAVVSTYYGGSFNLVSASSAITFDRINNGGVHANNGQSGFIFTGKLDIEAGGSASSFTMQNGELFLYGSAKDITINGGRVSAYSPAQLNGATINEGATLYLYNSGADIKKLEVNSGALVTIGSASATGLTVHSGGSLQVHNGGAASNVSIETGAVIHQPSYGRSFNLLSASSAITFDRINGDKAYANNGQTDFTFDGFLSIEAGGSASAFSMQNGELFLYGSAKDITIIGGRASAYNTAQLNGATINEGAILYLYYSGADVQNVEVNYGGLLTIGSASATGLTVHSGGSLQVHNGGAASNVSIETGAVIHQPSYGRYFNLISASSAITFDRINGDKFYTNNGQSDFTFDGILSIEAAGSASSFTMQNGELFLYGSAKDITINGGRVSAYSPAQLNGATINEGATLYLYNSGADVQNVEVNYGGLVTIGSASATGLTVHSGGSLQVYNGGAAFNVSIEEGAVVHQPSYGRSFNLISASSAIDVSIDGYGIYVRGHLSDITYSGQLCLSSGSYSNISAHQMLQLVSGATASDIEIIAGRLNVEAGAEISNITLTSSSYIEGSYRDPIDKLTLNSASYTISSGRVVSSGTVNRGGVMTVVSSGTLHHADAGEDGTVVIKDYSIISSATASCGGTVRMDGIHAKLSSCQVLSGGTLDLINGSVSEIIQEDGGAMQLNLKKNIEVSGSNKNGAFSVSGGTASNLLIHSGGILSVESGCSAVNTVMENGGRIRLTLSSVEDTTMISGSNESGAFSVENGVASNVILHSGASLRVSSDAYAVDIEVRMGAAVNGFMFQNDSSVEVLREGELNVSSVIIREQALIGSGHSISESIVKTGGLELYGSGDNMIVSGRGNISIGDQGFLSNVSLYGYDGGRSGGDICVSSGGTVYNATVGLYGDLYLFETGEAHQTVVQTGGRLYLGFNDEDNGYNDGHRGSRGGLAYDTILESGGSMRMYASGRADNVEVNSGASATLAGGNIEDMIVSAGGQVFISSGAVVRGLVENGGYISVAAGADVSFVSNIISGLLISGFSATAHSNTVVEGATVSNGALFIYQGRTDSTNVEANGNLYIYDGGTANDITVNRNGRVYVSSGGLLNNITLASGHASDMVNVYVGGVIKNANVLNGGDLHLYGGYAKGVLLARSTTSYDWSDLLIDSGGYAEDVLVGYYGQLVINSGSASDVTVSSGALLNITKGSAEDIAISSGGRLYVSSGASVSEIVNGGSMYVSSGGTATGIIENGGYVWYANEDDVSFTSNTFSGMVLTGSVTVHSKTQAVDNTVDTNCSMFVFCGGLADGTTINSRGNLFISSGGYTTDTIVQSGGALQILESGVASETVIGNGTVNVGGGTVHVSSMNGGTLNVSNGGVANLNRTVFENNASVRINSAATMNMTMASGSATLSVDLGADLSITANDLSRMTFNFSGSGAIDLSGNYWGTTDIDAIYAKLGVDYSRVVIDDVLLTDPTTTFSIVSNSLNHNYMGKDTSSITFTFSHDIDVNTVSADKILMLSPTGDSMDIKEVSVDGKQIAITFDPLPVEGSYRITFADSIADIAGETLVSLRETGLADGVGELLNLRTDFTSPYVVKVSPDGDFAGTLTSFTVYFSGAVDPLTIPGNVQLVSPNGNVVTPAVYKSVSNSVFEFTIPEQTAYGAYQIKVSNNVMDYAGNKLDQNQNGIGGETEDISVTQFVIADVDLKIQNLELDKTILSLGESATLNWEVVNASGYPLYGSWTDGVYLSQDTRWDINDILLGSVTHPDGLEENQVLDSSLMVNLSGVREGSYYLLVRSDIYMQEQTNREAADAVQNLEAVAITVAIPQLTQDVATTGTIRKNGDFAYYRVHQDANQSLKLVLDSLTDNTNMELYLGYDSAPTAEIYDRKLTKLVDGSLYLDAQLSARDVYIMVQAKKVAGEFDYELTAQSVPMSITKVSGSGQGNRTTTYLDVSGVDLAADAVVVLRDAEGNEFAPTILNFIDSTRLKLEFEAGTLAPGDYTLSIVSGDEIAVYNDVITIADQSGARLDVSMDLPSAVGYHLISTLGVNYENSGYDASEAILIMVSPTQNNADGITRDGAIMTLNQALVNDGFWVKTLPEGFSTSVSFLATGESAGLILPGEKLSIDIYYTGWLQNYRGSWDFSYPAIDWNAKYITADNEQEIDWNSFFLNNNYSEEYRKFLVGAFQESIGTTWGSYVKMLSHNLKYLDDLGLDVSAAGNSYAVDSNVLYTFELKQVDGAFSPYLKLETATDISSGTIQFSREYFSNVSRRYHESSFGYGWTCNWDISLSFEENGDIVFHNGDTITTFQPTFYDTYTALGTGVLVKNSNGYTVATSAGDTYVFDKNGTLLSVKDKRNTVITADYSEGKLIRLTGSDGSSVDITWNAAGYIESLTDSSGTVLLYSYDDAGNLLSAGDTVYTYDSRLDHALASVGTDTRFGYNEKGLLADVIRGSEEIDLQYGQNGEIHETSNSGTDIVRYYGANGKVLKEVDNASGVTTKYKYDGNNLLSVTDSEGNSKTYKYDSNGKLLSYSVNGKEVGYTYDADGNIATYTGEDGITTSYDYDRNRNRTAAYYADGTAEYWDYDLAGNMIGYIDVNGLDLSYQYDEQGKCISVNLDDSNISKSGMVYGTFTVDGMPWDNSWLTITKNAPDDLTVKVEHGQDYYFCVEGLDAGDYTLELSTDDGTGTSYFTKVIVAENSNVNLGNIELFTGGNLNFSLDINYNATNDIIVAGLYKDDIAVATTYLNESGEYSFANIAPGNYTLKLNSLQYPQYDLEQVVSILSGKTTEINLATDYGVTVSGTIVDANGNPHSNLLLELVCGDNWQYTYTDNKGQYTFDNASCGDNTLSIIETKEVLDSFVIAAEQKESILNDQTTDFTASWSGWISNDNSNGLLQILYLFRNDELVSENYLFSDYFSYNMKETGQYRLVLQNGSDYYTVDEITISNGDYIEERYTLSPVSELDLNLNLVENNSILFSDAAKNIIESNEGGLGQYNINYSKMMYDSLWERCQVYLSPKNPCKKCDCFKSEIEAYQQLQSVLRREFSYANRWISIAETGIDSKKWLKWARFFMGCKTVGDIGMAIGGKLSKIKIAYEALDKVEALMELYLFTENGVQDSLDAIALGGDYLSLIGIENFKYNNEVGTVLKISVDLATFHTIKKELSITDKNITNALNEATKRLSNIRLNYRPSIDAALSKLESLSCSDPGHICDCNDPSKCPHCHSTICEGEVLVEYDDHWEHFNVNTGETLCSGTYDPNDILGPKGFGEQGFISPQTMDYTIQFENDPEWANSPVKWVRIINPLDMDLDPETVQFKEICLAGNLIKLDGQSSYNQRVTVTVEGKEITVDVKLNVVYNEETETWQMVTEFMAIDPETGYMIQDVDLGFLYPNDESGRGDGHVRYTVELAEDAETGTEITNSAKIYFDFNEPIDTPVWTNTIDADLPSAAEFTAVPSEESSDITLSLTATDAASGIAGFNILYSTDNGVTYLSYGFVAGNEQVFAAQSGASYLFKAQAVDNAGNKSEWSEEVSVTALDVGYPVLSEEFSVAVDGYSAIFTWGEATDNEAVAGYKLVIDGNEHLVTGTSFTAENLAIGNHTYRLCAYDAGNLETWTDTRRFSIVDVTAPTLTGKPDANVSGSTVVFSWSAATDNVRVAGYRLAIGDQVYTTKNTTFTLSDVYFGDYTYRQGAVDEAGNESWSEEQTFTVNRAVLSEDTLLPHIVAHADYTAGCVPTAIGMLIGYYDQYGYNGYCLANLLKGTTIAVTDGIADSTLTDFIASEGHFARFVGISAEDELAYTLDPETKQLQTVSWDCLADWLGTSQYWRGNSDNAASYYSKSLSWLLSTPQTYSVGGYLLPARFTDFKYGLSLYLNSVGYSLDADATRTVDAGDYSFDDFKAEIDAGHVVLVSLSANSGGHMVAAYGYNADTKEIIFDDTYRADCRMTWGETYTIDSSVYSISAVTTVVFDTTGLFMDLVAPAMTDDVLMTIHGKQATISWTAATDASDVFYALKINGELYENISETSFVLSDMKVGQYTYSLAAYDAAGNYSIWTEEKELIVTEQDLLEPVLESDVLPQTQTWEKVAGSAKYIVEYSTDNFEHVVQLVVDSNSLDSFQMPAGSYQMRVKADGGGEWTVAAPVVSEETNYEPKLILSNEDGIADVFFVNSVGTWGSIYAARHTGSIDDVWGGTGEVVVLFGRNKLTDVIEGSTDANVLLMTDDANGDALFVDDIYSASPDELGLSQSRIAQIDEIRAGAGDDIIDMTSDKFEYIGDGLTIRGGDGDDTVWANKGDNFLFGDAGNDRIVGASGNDVIAGGIGNDRMHGGGGNDVFTFGENWGTDTVEQLESGLVTLWFASGSETNWNAETLAYTDGDNSVKVSGVAAEKVTLRFGDDGSDQFATLSGMGAFFDATSERIFEEPGKGILASL